MSMGNWQVVTGVRSENTTRTDWPILDGLVIHTSYGGTFDELPTRSFVAPNLSGDWTNDRARRAARRAIDEFRPAFDRLGKE